MIAMQLDEAPCRGTAAPSYTATATWAGATHTVSSRSEPSCKLARHLVQLGAEDQPWTATQGGTVVWRGRSLHAWANLTVEEGERQRPRFRPYSPFESASSARVVPPQAASASRPAHRMPDGVAPSSTATSKAAP